MAGAAHFEDFGISFVLLARAAAKRSPRPTGDFD